MSPTQAVEKTREMLFDQLHDGKGMIPKSTVLAIIREIENTTIDGFEEMHFLRETINTDNRECFTYQELLKKIASVERDMIDYGDVT